MSIYQDIISSHLKILFDRGDNVTPVVVIASWYIDGEENPKENTGYLQFVGIKKILPC